MNRDKEDMDTGMFLWLVALLVVLVGIPALYAARADVVNGALLLFAKMQIKAFAPFFEDARTAWARIAELDPASLTWEQMQRILSYTGRWVRWPFALLLGLLGAASVYISVTRGCSRRLNMEKLLRNNAESFACLRPVVGRGKYLLSPKSRDSGLWRIARSPVQFALEHGLLTDEHGTPFLPEQALHNGLASVELPAYGRARLDEKKALAVLQAQLGPAFTSFENLEPDRKALAAAFVAYAGGDKDGCVGILDAVSISYREIGGKPESRILEQDVFRQRLEVICEAHQRVLAEKPLARHSAFVLPWFMALLTRARQKGVLASSQFLWLRPMDRSLWYALNQCGGRAAWAEGLAPWAHYVAEEKAGKALSDPHVARAAASLRDALFAQGWLEDTPSAPALRERPQTVPDSGEQTGEAAAGAVAVNLVNVPAVSDSPIEPPPEMVYADAEEDPEYDAHEDKRLAQEMI